MMLSALTPREIILLYVDYFASHVDRYSMSVVGAFVLVLLAAWAIERYRRRRNTTRSS
jgi:hypothetical protein